ncbi:hypothetical protein [Levilactobacillus tujiorum]|uniref:hypothetical protein n=1 Tax=Levilactobacillus tujiorum TaxID=2912243 RepID=UPI0014575F7C|nr:hypothetical protein [Levilactobacillus tujiorum]NLR32246.1 hypothetical protein [Levilactobacillus tujiorum]
MKRLVTLTLTLLATVSLAACSSSASSSGNSTSSSESSSASSSSKEADQGTQTPSEKAIDSALDKAKSISKSDMIEQVENDANVRFSDITESSNRDKYTGKAKTFSGKVFDSDETTDSSTHVYYVEDNANSDHVFVVETNKSGIRKDDMLMVDGIVAGKFTYSTNDNSRIDAVMIISEKQFVQNSGDAEE